MARKLTAKQKAFCEEYIVDLNATQAAIRAGYSSKRADAIGYDLLRNTEVKRRIGVVMEERSKRTQINADWVLTELKRQYDTGLSTFLNIPKEDGVHPTVDLSKATQDQIDTLAEIIVDSVGEDVTRVKIKTASRLDILEKIGKHVDVQAWKDKAPDDIPSGDNVTLPAWMLDMIRPKVKKDE